MVSRSCRWNFIAVEIIQQLSLHPDLKNITKIGHTLGGSLEMLVDICLPSLDVLLRRIQNLSKASFSFLDRALINLEQRIR